MEPMKQSVNHTNGKQAYSTPQVREWGTISQVTADQGMSFLTDAGMTGSMAFAGMSGEAMGGM